MADGILFVAISQQKELITEPQSAVTQDAEKSGEEGSLPEKSGKCIHRPEFKCTLEEAYKLTPGTGEDCGCKCCWECVKHGNCEWECNSSLHRPEEPEKAKDYGTLDTIGGVPVYSLKSQETVDGAYGLERSKIYDGSILLSMIKVEEEELDRMGPERIEKNPYNYT